MQVEFNKAAQSLTEAVVPSAQKKAALHRLLKVAFAFELFYLEPVSVSENVDIFWFVHFFLFC